MLSLEKQKKSGMMTRRVPLIDILLKRLDCDPNGRISTCIHPRISQENDSSTKASKFSKKNDALATLCGPEGGGRLDISAKNNRIAKIFSSREFSLEEKWDLKHKSVTKTSLQHSISPLSSTEDTTKISWESSDEGAKVSIKHLANSFCVRKDALDVFPEYSLQTGSCYFWEQRAFDDNLTIFPDEWYLRYPNKELNRDEEKITLNLDDESSPISRNETDRLDSVDGHLQWDKIASCSPSLEQEIGFDDSKHINRGWRRKEHKWDIDTRGTPSNSLKMTHYHDSHSEALPLAKILEIADDIDNHMASRQDSGIRTPLISSSCKDYAFDVRFLADDEDLKLRSPSSTEIFQQQITPRQEFFSHLHASPVSDSSPNLRGSSLKRLENFKFPRFSPTHRPLVESPCDKFFSPYEDEVRMRETSDEWAEDFKASEATFQGPRLASFRDVLCDADCWDVVSSDTLGDL